MDEDWRITRHSIPRDQRRRSRESPVVLKIMTKKSYFICMLLGVVFLLIDIASLIYKETRRDGPQTGDHVGRLRHGRTGRAMPLPTPLERSLQRLANRSSDHRSPHGRNKAVFVTAISKGRFDEAKGAIASVQHYFPLTPIYVYGLNLGQYQVKQIRQWCGVKYHTFNFSKYPRHMAKLSTSAWRPAVIQEALQQTDSVVYLDTAMRVTCPGLVEQLSAVADRTGGIAVCGTEDRALRALTASAMFDYLNLHPRHTSAHMLSASLVLVANTQDLLAHVLNWWFRCAATWECVAPPGSLGGCSLESSVSKNSTNVCHRFDQSALNILLLGHFDGDVSKYHARDACADYMSEYMVSPDLRLCAVSPDVRRRRAATKTRQKAD